MALLLGIVGPAAEFVPKVCSGHQPRQTRRSPCHWSGGVPACLGSTDASNSCCWDRCCIFLTSDPMILDEFEHRGVELSLGVVGLAMEFVPKVCLLFVSIWLISVLCLIISCHLLLLAISASFGSRAYRSSIKLLVYGLSTFFLEALTAISFPHSTAFIVSHKFGYNMPSFSLNSKKSLISLFLP